MRAALPSLIALLSDSDWRIRGYTLVTLTPLAGIGALPPCFTASILSTPFEAEWHEDFHPAVSGMIATLTDSEDSVRTQALRSLSEIFQFGPLSPCFAFYYSNLVRS